MGTRRFPTGHAPGWVQHAGGSPANETAGTFFAAAPMPTPTIASVSSELIGISSAPTSGFMRPVTASPTARDNPKGSHFAIFTYFRLKAQAGRGSTVGVYCLMLRNAESSPAEEVGDTLNIKT